MESTDTSVDSLLLPRDLVKAGHHQGPNWERGGVRYLTPELGLRVLGGDELTFEGRGV